MVTEKTAARTPLHHCSYISRAPAGQPDFAAADRQVLQKDVLQFACRHH